MSRATRLSMEPTASRISRTPTRISSFPRSKSQTYPRRPSSISGNQRSTSLVSRRSNSSSDDNIKTMEVSAFSLCKSNLYTTVFGPTADETILLGLKAFMSICSDENQQEQQQQLSTEPERSSSMERISDEDPNRSTDSSDPLLEPECPHPCDYLEEQGEMICSDMTSSESQTAGIPTGSSAFQTDPYATSGLSFRLPRSVSDFVTHEPSEDLKPGPSVLKSVESSYYTPPEEDYFDPEAHSSAIRGPYDASSAFRPGEPFGEEEEELYSSSVLPPGALQQHNSSIRGPGMDPTQSRMSRYSRADPSTFTMQSQMGRAEPSTMTASNSTYPFDRSGQETILNRPSVMPQSKSCMSRMTARGMDNSGSGIDPTQSRMSRFTRGEPSTFTMQSQMSRGPDGGFGMDATQSRMSKFRGSPSSHTIQTQMSRVIGSGGTMDPTQSRMSRFTRGDPSTYTMQSQMSRVSRCSSRAPTVRTCASMRGRSSSHSPSTMTAVGSSFIENQSGLNYSQQPTLPMQSHMGQPSSRGQPSFMMPNAVSVMGHQPSLETQEEAYIGSQSPTNVDNISGDASQVTAFQVADAIASSTTQAMGPEESFHPARSQSMAVKSSLKPSADTHSSTMTDPVPKILQTSSTSTAPDDTWSKDASSETCSCCSCSDALLPANTSCSCCVRKQESAKSCDCCGGTKPKKRSLSNKKSGSSSSSLRSDCCGKCATLKQESAKSCDCCGISKPKKRCLSNKKSGSSSSSLRSDYTGRCSKRSSPKTCDCCTSTTTSDYDSECGMTNEAGDGSNCELRYAICKITKFCNYTTFEVMKSTKKKPKIMPRTLEGVFVLKNKDNVEGHECVRTVVLGCK